MFQFSCLFSGFVALAQGWKKMAESRFWEVLHFERKLQDRNIKLIAYSYAQIYHSSAVTYSAQKINPNWIEASHNPQVQAIL